MCFGSNVCTNEFRYTLIERKGGASLQRCRFEGATKTPAGSKKPLPSAVSSPSEHKSPDTSHGDVTITNNTAPLPLPQTKDVTPPLTPTSACDETCKSSQAQQFVCGATDVLVNSSSSEVGVESSPVSVPHDSESSHSSVPCDSVESGHSSVPYNSVESGLTSVPHDSVESGLTSVPHDSNIIENTKTAGSIRPPLSTVSPKLASQLCVAALFDEVPCCSDESKVSEAVFGSVSTDGEPSAVKRLKLDSDAATIQTELAKEESDRERHSLLSKIQALKSELEAKEQLLVGRDEAAAEERANRNSSMLLTMQEEFTCVICQELFISAHTLPCAHSFCEWCIKEWTKCQRRNDCPICRKRMTTDPVHSLVLDNAIDKIVEKLDSEAREERGRLKRTREESLRKLPAPAATAVGRAAPAVSVTRGVTIVISPPSRTSRERPIVLDGSDSDDSESDDGESSDGESDDGESDDSESDESDDSESDDSDNSDDSDSYTEGLPGAYYGGYGRCYSCGQFFVAFVRSS